MKNKVIIVDGQDVNREVDRPSPQDMEAAISPRWFRSSVTRKNVQMWELDEGNDFEYRWDRVVGTDKKGRDITAENLVLVAGGTTRTLEQAWDLEQQRLAYIRWVEKEEAKLEQQRRDKARGSLRI